MTTIPMLRAVLCVSCDTISDANASRCPACGADGSLLSLARVLNPTPELGTITFIHSERVKTDTI